MADIKDVLYGISGVDSFLRWIVEEAEKLEDKIFDTESVYTEEEIFKMISRYETLLEIRDKYCEFQESKS